MSTLRAISIAGSILLCASCGGDLTEILVVVDSDLAVPDALDGLRVEVSGVESMSADGSLRSNAIPLPRTVGVVHRGGELGPIEVRAIGTLGGVEVVRATAITSFIRGRTLVLPLFLSRSCVRVSCGNAETCAGGVCQSAAVDASTLEDWNGSVGRLDGGAPCEPVTERCNAADDDCDGTIDEGFDLDTDPLNCGRCFNVCSTNHATSSCAAGTCSIGTCDTGFEDCDGDAADGCETELATSPLSCGACGNVCSFANATATCMDATCALEACNTGFADCNADASDGCEASLDSATDCGGCGVTCAFPGASGVCVGGACELGACDAGFGDCNTDPSDGCETALDTLTDCGTCGMACSVPNATPTCASGTCEVDSCDAGFGDCNTDPSDGCETPMNTLASCGACGTACALPNATETCDTGTCEVLACNTGRGDCDGVASNGCETDTTRNDSHCGMCGNACAPGDNCRSSVCR